MNSEKPKIVVICGPTGVGKTSAAIEAAEEFGGEIINADSMQIYTYMDIGTAKPTLDEQARITHHLIDIVCPDEPFDAAMYAKMARKSIASLDKRNILPFVVGGTGFYIKALLHGLFVEGNSDPDIRMRLKNDLETYGADHLYSRLKQHDPAGARKIHLNDTYRIIRALEIYEITGKSITEYHEKHGFQDDKFRFLKIGLDMDRDVLYKRINSRVDAMVEEGLEQEVRDLLNLGYTEDLKPMQSIGYRHMADYINGRLSWDEALLTLKRDTRRYAKRQMTWFKSDSRTVWMEPGRIKDIVHEIKKFLLST